MHGYVLFSQLFGSKHISNNVVSPPSRLPPPHHHYHRHLLNSLSILTQKRIGFDMDLQF